MLTLPKPNGRDLANPKTLDLLAGRESRSLRERAVGNAIRGAESLVDFLEAGRGFRKGILKRLGVAALRMLLALQPVAEDLREESRCHEFLGEAIMEDLCELAPLGFQQAAEIAGEPVEAFGGGLQVRIGGTSFCHKSYIGARRRSGFMKYVREQGHRRKQAECGRPPCRVATVSSSKIMNADPRYKYPQPPFPQEKIDPPGDESEMRPQSDHGEKSYKGHGRLNGKRALITGGDSGIGRAVAIAFAREGASVAINYLNESEDAEETARLVKEAGQEALLLPGNLSKKAVCEEIGEKTLSAFGGLDILVNNAAFQRTYDDFTSIPDEEFEETFRVNVFAMYWLCKLLLPKIPAGGSIINTASIQSFDPSENLIAYAATKAAIASFTRSLAAHAIESGVRVNAVAPGPVWTPLIPATMPAEAVKKFGSTSVFKRPGQPAEMAPIFVFLASDEASYVTGEVYGATGGQMPI